MSSSSLAGCGCARSGSRARLATLTLTVATTLFDLSCARPRGTVGAVFAQAHEDGTVHVRDAPEQLSAARAGVLPGDELLLIDGQDVRPLSPDQLHELLGGPPGSVVRLTMLRAGVIRRVKITRTAAPEQEGPRASKFIR